MTTPAKGLRHCHHPMIDSVILSTDPMVRAFIATGRSGLRTVAPHSHRSSIKLTVLRGTVDHWTFYPEFTKSPFTEDAKLYSYKSELLGGVGLSTTWKLVDYTRTYSELRVDDHLVLPWDFIHTVEWSDNAMWRVEEGPLMTEETKVMIRPDRDHFDTEGLYVPMTDDEWAFQADKVWRIWKNN